MKMNYRQSLAVLMISVVGIFSGRSLVLAAPLDIANAPLFLGTAVDPNIFYVLDDSGSMDWEILTVEYFPSYCYDRNHPGSVSTSDCSTGNIQDNGLWYERGGGGHQTFEYIFINNDSAYTGGCTSSRERVEDCNDSGTESNWVHSYDWRIYSSDFNVVYYDPEVTYMPWLGTGMTDASFTAARSNPEPASAGYALTKDLSNWDNGFLHNARDDTNGTVDNDYDDGFVFNIWTDSHGWDDADGHPDRGSDFDREVGANGWVDVYDEYVMYVVMAAEVRWIRFGWAEHGDGGIKRVVLANGAFSGTATDPNGNNEGRTAAEIQQNVANWYQYARRRMFVAKGAIAALTMQSSSSNFRFGATVINEAGLGSNEIFETVPAANIDNYASHNEDLLEALFQYPQQSNGTPLRTGLRTAGRYYQDNLTLDGTNFINPIVETCQQNFSILFTDGYYNGGDPSFGNVDSDPYSNTLADVAYYYYTTDLAPGMADEVPASGPDPANHQHMVTFTAAFGVSGVLSDNDGDGWPNPVLEEDDDWGTTSTDSGKIDDMWHAAYNSKGSFISATTPSDLINGLQDALNEISDRVGASASIAANSTSLRVGTRIYQASFFSGAWYGSLQSLKINPTDFSISNTPDWRAEDELDDLVAGLGYSTDRVVITYNPDAANLTLGFGKGIPFRFPANYQSLTTNEMTLSQVDALTPNSVATVDTAEIAQNKSEGLDALNYLRGDRSNEVIAGGVLRSRTHVLGDVHESSPQFVGPPNTFIADSLETAKYSTFRKAYENRRQVIYVGANDGMLHAFDAGLPPNRSCDPLTDANNCIDPGSGEELLAYVPSSVYGNLWGLTLPNYAHRFFVNSTPSISDVFYNGAWHTVLIGALGAGGQGYYALDITDPSAFKESNADDLVLWEFTDDNRHSATIADGVAGASGDKDLGYSFSRPSIVRLANGSWAAVFGNGYNNTEGSSPTSTTGTAILYIVDIGTGKLIKRIDTGVGSAATPNGLSTPALVDADNDSIYDYAYAGDLYGNMWRFDLDDDDTANWEIAYSGAPIFTGNSGQSITAKPVVNEHPRGFGLLIYFGTGQYLQVGDNTSSGQSTQSFYAVWDNTSATNLTYPVDTSDMLEQTIDNEFTVSGLDLRHTSDNSISWGTHRGWYMDFEYSGANNGERIVSDALLRGNRVYFVTLVPSLGGCAGDGVSWIAALDSRDGSRLVVSPIDVNGDGTIDTDDYVSSKPISMWKVNGIVTTPTVLADQSEATGDSDDVLMECDEAMLIQDSTGNVDGTKASGSLCAFGRRSWRQLN